MITTALSIRIVSSLFFLVVARYFRVIGRRSEFSPFVEIALVFLVRDLAAIALPDTIFPYTETVAFAGAYLLFLRWTGGYRRSNRSFRLAAASTGVVALVVLLARVAPAELGAVARFLFWFFPPAIIGFAFLGITRIDRYTSPRGFDIEMLQPWLQGLLVLLAVVHMVVPFFPGETALILGWVDMTPFLVTMFFLFNLYVVELRGKGRSLRRNAQSIFAFLSGVGNALGEETTPAAILTSAIDTMVDATDGDGGVAVIVEPAGSRVCAVNGLFPPPFAVPDVVKTKPGALQRYLESRGADDVPIWGEALRNGRPRLIARASGDPHYAQHATDRTFLLRSVLILPLQVRGRVLGLLSVIRRAGSNDFTQSDFDHARTMANFVAVTLDNYHSYIRMVEGQRLQRDVEIAGEIQAELQAAADIERGNISFSGLNRPVRGLGGDYYDVIPLEQNRTAVVICDVSGKGVPAALVMVMVRTIAHIALQETQDAGAVLARINTGLTGSVAPDRFATVSVAVFDPGNGRVSYANAGHHPLMLARGVDGTDGAGGITEIDAEGLPVGIEPDGEYTCREIPFPPGSTALLYTDGVVEALSPAGDEYGTERVTTALARAAAGTRESRSVLDELMTDVDSFIGGAPVQDDITMLVCTNRGRSHPLEDGE